VSRDRLGFPWNAEVVEFLGGMGHYTPIRLASHQDTDQRFLCFCWHKNQSICFNGRRVNLAKREKSNPVLKSARASTLSLLLSGRA
jgi:hypothetical protein